MVDWCSAILLLITTALISVQADTPSGRANHGCVLLKATIYCYGGATRATDRTTTALNSNLMYYLDLSEEKSVSDLSQSWTPYSSGNVGSNFYFAMAALPELNSFIIDGGRGTGQEGYSTQVPTVLFNATGSGAFNTSIPNGGHALVDSNTAVSDANNMVYLAGGRSSGLYNNASGAMQFPVQMVTLNVPSITWSSTPATLQSASSQTRLHHQGALGKDGQTIYYVGGIHPASPIDQAGTMYYYGHVNMTEILTYNTAQAQWSTHTATGVEPAPRMDHTLTLKPSTGELIIYGGTQLDSALPIDDYFYILDTDSMTYRTQALGTSDGAPGAGPRFGHAAVLVGNNSLFIIFGSTGNSDSALNVLDIDSWSWASTVPAIIVPDLQNDGDSNDTTPGNENGDQSGNDEHDSNDEQDGDSSSSTTSAGTIAGAAVGSVAGVAIIGALVFFFLRKRRNNNSDMNANSNEPAREEAAGRRLKALEANNVPAPPYTDSSSPLVSPSHQFLPVYESGKPDGSSVGEENVQRLVMQPVKPDSGS